MATNNLSVTYYQTPSDVFRPLGLKTPEQEKNVNESMRSLIGAYVKTTYNQKQGQNSKIGKTF